MKPPPHAQLLAGVTEEDIIEAVAKSGYPLQAAISDRIHRSLKDYNISIQEEWGFVDAESGETRALDIYAHAPLIPSRYLPVESRITPWLNLLVECKHSEVPYIFFLRENYPAEVIYYPEISGVPSLDITAFIEQDEKRDSRTLFQVSIHDALMRHNIPFCNAPAPLAISIAKASRKGGGKLELSGEPYRSITFPLMKAIDHLKMILQPSKDRTDYTLHFIIGLVVIDAPMVGVYLHGSSHELLSTPWVRACRVDAEAPLENYSRTPIDDGNVRYYDIIHSSFLPDYLELVLRDLGTASARAMQIADVIADGRGIMRVNKSSLFDFFPASDSHPQFSSSDSTSRGTRIAFTVPPIFKLAPPEQYPGSDCMHWLSPEDFGA
ncbi:hypothetical protein OIE67_13695 [Nonomuraea fuscirosea]|uniref:hypothetical protein n=1 Tax=Nonomuraea fuscirosea TaxID=1291556 RepID=UPI002DD902A3|nr:hypothetical protein [Nonomuraea fuscirosea]WSA55608.1 hypothetical protein OIE67_13695 [Nonomuraea fuscirosea]